MKDARKSPAPADRAWIAGLLDRVASGRDLSEAEAREVMDRIMAGELGDLHLAALLAALRTKGETAEEIAGFAAAMRDAAIPVRPTRTGLIDTCGTGGDGKHTLNISTAAAILAAALGIPVAKHGNRSVSSRSGSADVLEALGVRIDLPAPAVAACIDRVGIGFLFARTLHPAMKHAAGARKALGIRTVFNILGPLTNPARVEHQLLGVFDGSLGPTLCRVLDKLGAKKAFVVHGRDGTDEVSIAADTEVCALEEGKIRAFTFRPEEAGLERGTLADVAGGTAEENAARIAAILAGREQGPAADAVALNAGFAAVVAGKAADPAAGVRLAREALQAGKAAAVLDALRRLTAEPAAGTEPEKGGAP